MCWQFPYNFCGFKMKLSVGSWQTSAGWIDDLGDLLENTTASRTPRWGMEPDQRGESSVLDPALAFLNTVALACFEILSYLLAAVPTDISLSVVEMIAKEDTSGLSLSCCWRVCCFAPVCHHFMERHPFKGREGVSLLLIVSLAWDLTSNTEVIPSLAAVLLRQWSYLAVKAEEIGLLSVLGWKRSEELRGAAENDSKGKASILSWSFHLGRPSYSKTGVVLWSSAWARSLGRSCPAAEAGWALVLCFPILQAA